MNTTQLECFMAVSNFLNFSRAAEHLRLTQPAVSHQINSLEDELGVKLFHRTSTRADSGGPSVLPVRSRDSVPVPPVQREAEGKPADLSDPFRHWVSQFFGTGADQAGAQTTAGGFSTSSSRSASGLLCLFGELAGRWRGPSHAHLSGQLPKTGSLPGIVPAAHRVYLCRMPPFCLSRGLVCSAAAHRRTVCSLSPPQRSPPVA